eukprot:gene41160-50221_t
MLEGDEILETAQETGYRLCVADNNASVNKREKIFSAVWDQCLPRRLWVCKQSGELEVHDLNSGKHQCYQTKFRRYVSAHDPRDQSDEKVVSAHWDKMITIPHRPHEVLFLLGISKSLLYTSLPSPDPCPAPYSQYVPVLSAYTKRDPGYVHGSPVMQVCSHSSRITSLAVTPPAAPHSPSWASAAAYSSASTSSSAAAAAPALASASPGGELLAVGDEAGQVRLVFLQLLDSVGRLHSAHPAPSSSQQAPRLSAYRPFLPSYMVLRQLHSSPIFSLCFLPPSPSPASASSSSSGGRRGEAAEQQQSVLVSGAGDRTVGVWLVQASVLHGVSLSPLRTL